VVRVARVRPRVTLEDLVERLVERVGEADLVTEGHEHLLQQREARALRGLDVYRLDVQQAAAHGQGQQVPVDDVRLPLAQQVERLRDRGVGVEDVLHLARSRDRRVARQLEQTQDRKSTR